MDSTRRATDRVEGRYVLAVLYTFGFLALIGALLFLEVPTNNREMLLTLIGLMSAAQLGIIKYYYDGAKSSSEARARTESVMQQMAKDSSRADL